MRSLAILVLTVTFAAQFCLNIALKKRPICPKRCNMDFEPVCGIRFGSELPNQCTFHNICLLYLYICQTKEKWITMSVRAVCHNQSPQCYEIYAYFRNHTGMFNYGDSYSFDYY